MALDTYANLQTAIGNWLNRSDLTSAIPDFITLAEAQMRRAFKESLAKGKMLPRKMVANTTLSLTPGTEFINVPTDFLGVLSFYLDPQTVNGNTVGAIQLDYLSPMNLELLKQRRGPNAVNWTPGVYSILASQFQFLPIPDFTYTATLWYWQDFASLSTGNASNWILANHPDAYLYGALVQSAPYLSDDQRAQMWATFFTTVLDDIIKSDPLPKDRAWLRMDPGLIYRTLGMSAFNINSGDFTVQP